MKDVKKKYKNMQTPVAGGSSRCTDAAHNSITQEPIVQEDQPSNPGHSVPGIASKSAALKKQGPMAKKPAAPKNKGAFFLFRLLSDQ